MIRAAVVALSVAFCGSAVAADPLLLGRWQYLRYRYRGAEIPRADPALILTIDFKKSSNTLAWRRTGDGGSCERRAAYETAGGSLIQKVVWVSPNNAAGCGADPDMRIGSESRTPYRLRNGTLETDFPLGEETVTYLWERRK